jgi:hypothetical protein
MITLGYLCLDLLVRFCPHQPPLTPSVGLAPTEGEALKPLGAIVVHGAQHPLLVLAR